jgi:hypothetical protein
MLENKGAVFQNLLDIRTIGQVRGVADKEPQQDITDIDTPRNFFHYFSSLRSISNRKMRR